MTTSTSSTRRSLRDAIQERTAVSPAGPSVPPAPREHILNLPGPDLVGGTVLLLAGVLVFTAAMGADAYLNTTGGRPTLPVLLLIVSAAVLGIYGFFNGYQLRQRRPAPEELEAEGGQPVWTAELIPVTYDIYRLGESLLFQASCDRGIFRIRQLSQVDAASELIAQRRPDLAKALCPELLSEIIAVEQLGHLRTI